MDSAATAAAIAPFFFDCLIPLCYLGWAGLVSSSGRPGSRRCGLHAPAGRTRVTSPGEWRLCRRDPAYIRRLPGCIDGSSLLFQSTAGSYFRLQIVDLDWDPSCAVAAPKSFFADAHTPAAGVSVAFFARSCTFRRAVRGSKAQVAGSAASCRESLAEGKSGREVSSHFNAHSESSMKSCWRLARSMSCLGNHRGAGRFGC